MSCAWSELTARRRSRLCWRVERRDGVAIGLTAHDRDLVIDGLVYRARAGDDAVGDRARRTGWRRTRWTSRAR